MAYPKAKCPHCGSSSVSRDRHKKYTYSGFEQLVIAATMRRCVVCEACGAPFTMSSLRKISNRGAFADSEAAYDAAEL